MYSYVCFIFRLHLPFLSPVLPKKQILNLTRKFIFPSLSLSLQSIVPNPSSEYSPPRVSWRNLRSNFSLQRHGHVRAYYHKLLVITIVIAWQLITISRGGPAGCWTGPAGRGGGHLPWEELIWVIQESAGTAGPLRGESAAAELNTQPSDLSFDMTTQALVPNTWYIVTRGQLRILWSFCKWTSISCLLRGNWGESQNIFSLYQQELIQV